ncbi:TIGR01841 family phasin [Pseudoduganella lutea]|uniref:Phasin family protein n=2 Tax=Pseudoduganella lutea TaxID=321985 RepID=A0A4P6L4Z7_9BURK|nr:TIGR01841 family phasin [Pseudoduganella lutea]QBE66415.1 phasin family protein [Pseudoduganella lutea]QBE67550.1 phasin family protein [Pseudoduganella lutea]
MFPFSPEVTPAVRAHLDAQMAYLNEMSNAMSRSFQSLCEANIQLTQSLLEDSAIASQQFLAAATPAEALAVATARAQPASSKLQAYRQQIARVATDAQVELARVSSEHVPQTSRTAQSLAQEVARVAVDQTQRNVRQQEENLKNFRNPFEGMRGESGNASMQAHATMQSAGSAGAQVDAGNGSKAEGNAQGSAAAPNDKSNKHS